MTTDLTTRDNEMITTKELAEQLGTSVKVVLDNARKCLPNKEIRNGKPTYWSKEEVTVVLEQMKENPKTNSSDLYFESKATTSTDMTPALKLRKAMELANEAYQEEIERLKALNIEVLNENGQLKLVAKQAVERAEVAEKETKKVKKDALVIAGWSEQRSVLAYSIAHHLNWNLSKRKEVGKQLSAIARQFNHQVGKVPDRDFGEVNAYGADTWALWESRFRNY